MRRVCLLLAVTLLATLALAGSAHAAKRLSAAQVAKALNAKHAFLWDGKGDNPLLGMLAHADAILVTSDSTNMMVEAAGTGKPVHILQLASSNPKFDRLVDKLTEMGVARLFKGRIENWTYDPLNETARIADLIRGKLVNFL